MLEYHTKLIKDSILEIHHVRLKQGGYFRELDATFYFEGPTNGEKTELGVMCRSLGQIVVGFDMAKPDGWRGWFKEEKPLASLDDVREYLSGIEHIGEPTGVTEEFLVYEWIVEREGKLPQFDIVAVSTTSWLNQAERVNSPNDNYALKQAKFSGPGTEDFIRNHLARFGKYDVGSILKEAASAHAIWRKEQDALEESRRRLEKEVASREAGSGQQ